MSEYLRHDFVSYSGGLGAGGIVIPQTTQLDRDGVQRIDCKHFNSVSVQLTGTWAGTVSLQFSNDGTTWITAPVTSPGGTPSTTSMTGNNLFISSVWGRYVRLNWTTYTSGTVAATLTLTAAYTPSQQNSNITPSPSASLGMSTTHHLISAATTNATSVKTSAGTVGSLVASNNGAAVAYLKLYNKASAPTVGTDTPVMTILLPINGTVSVSTGAFGIRFSTGIAYAITAGMAVADIAAVAATQVSVGMFYT